MVSIYYSTHWRRARDPKDYGRHGAMATCGARRHRLKT
ncbi:hypothetical protein GFS31_02810 [Leptolyngbya sp. BL0902]|nr:hypothetical protein GFS31_02810 [Leptolyngbya sp. BL0902]